MNVVIGMRDRVTGNIRVAEAAVKSPEHFFDAVEKMKHALKEKCIENDITTLICISGGKMKTEPTYEEASNEYAEKLMDDIVGSKITCLGANENGDIFLSFEKNGKTQDILIGKDDSGDIAIFEAQLGAVQ